MSKAAFPNLSGCQNTKPPEGGGLGGFGQCLSVSIRREKDSSLKLELFYQMGGHISSRALHLSIGRQGDRWIRIPTDSVLRQRNAPRHTGSELRSRFLQSSPACSWWRLSCDWLGGWARHSIHILHENQVNEYISSWRLRASLTFAFHQNCPCPLTVPLAFHSIRGMTGKVPVLE